MVFLLNKNGFELKNLHENNNKSKKDRGCLRVLAWR